jgi:hypothetical protein
MAWSVDLHLHPDIPAELLAGSRKNCKVPDVEQVIGVVDLTGNEDGDNCLVFGSTAIYIYNPPESRHPGYVVIPYTELQTRVFVNHGDSVYLGNDQFLHNSDSAVVECEQLMKLLNRIRDGVMAVETTAARLDL